MDTVALRLIYNLYLDLDLRLHLDLHLDLHLAPVLKITPN